MWTASNYLDACVLYDIINIRKVKHICKTINRAAEETPSSKIVLHLGHRENRLRAKLANLSLYIAQGLERTFQDQQDCTLKVEMKNNLRP